MDIKYIAEHERAAIPAGDFAGPNRTFPIRNQVDVMHASHLIGHAADPQAVKRKIIEIARRKGLDIPESWETGADEPDGDADDKKSVDTLIAFGSEVKNLGGGKIGGHLVLFSTAKDPDLAGDYFTKATDFDFEDGEARSGYYNHGLDIKMGNTKVGRGTLTKDDVGVWLEGQITLRDEYGAAVMKLVDDGELGLSSGALSHLVRREKATKGVTHVTHWPIGEWSLTPTPAEPRTQVVSIKSWAKALQMDTGLLGSSEYDPATDRYQQRPPDTQHQMAMGALYTLNKTLEDAVANALKGAAGVPRAAHADAVTTISDSFDKHAHVGKAMLNAMLGHVADDVKTISSLAEAERNLRDAGLSRTQAKTMIAQLKTLLRDAGSSAELPTRDGVDARMRELQLLALTGF